MVKYNEEQLFIQRKTHKLVIKDLCALWLESSLCKLVCAVTLASLEALLI